LSRWEPLTLSKSDHQRRVVILDVSIIKLLTNFGQWSRRHLSNDSLTRCGKWLEIA
jgi:hypothetical protein